jgi:hypothetical protein
MEKKINFKKKFKKIDNFLTKYNFEIIKKNKSGQFLNLAALKQLMFFIPKKELKELVNQKLIDHKKTSYM